MKKLLLLFVAATLLSCSSEDSEPVNQNPHMEFKGTWREVAMIPEGETELIDLTDCEQHPEARKFRFDNLINGACYMTNACEESNQQNVIFQKDNQNNNIYLSYIDSPINDYIERYSVTYYSDTKFGFKMIWNTVDDDVTNGKYIILERQQ